MNFMQTGDVDEVMVTAIEGVSVYGGHLRVKPMMMGDSMMAMEIHYAAGVGAPLHSHNHESLTYVIQGRFRMMVGEREYNVGPGDVCRHPKGVAHCVEALEDSVMIEVKSPAPEMASLFKFD